MCFDIAKPSLLLQPYIKQYWALEHVSGHFEPCTQRIIPTGLPELIFYFGNRPESDKRNLEGNALLNGQQNDFYDLIIDNRLSLFAITFQPNGLSHFLKLPLHELQNRVVYLEQIDKSFSRHLEELLVEGKNFAERVSIAETFLMKHVSNHNNTVDHQRMAGTIRAIRATKGKVPIDHLASGACVSRKQFERIFLSQIGISPKQFLKIVRFQHAIQIKGSAKYTNLSELAYESGYYDQSHFVKEIKDLTGETPKKFFSFDCSASDFFC